MLFSFHARLFRKLYRPNRIMEFAMATQTTYEGNPFPIENHVVLARKEPQRDVVIVGDPHGCLDELKNLLQLCGWAMDSSTNPLVIIAGDLVNKGPHSAATVAFCREQGIRSVRGNHDEYYLAMCLRVGKFVDRVPERHAENVAAFTEQDVSYMANLPFTISLPWLRLFSSPDLTEGVIIVHAGLVPLVPLANQTDLNMTKMRYVNKKHDRWVAHEKAVDDGELWAKTWSSCDSSRHFVFFGHDASAGLQTHSKAIGLDTGCVYGRCLTAAMLRVRQDGLYAVEFKQVDARRVHKMGSNK